jgi:hypothetical protein
MTKKLFQAVMIGIMVVGLSACMTVTLPLSVTNGPVGTPNQQVSAVATDKEAFWFFSLNDDNQYHHDLAERVRAKLGKQCVGGNLSHIALDVSQSSYVVVEVTKARATATCTK